MAKKILVVAFEGWNDAGEAASCVVNMLKKQLKVSVQVSLDSEDYFDFHYSRPTIATSDEGERKISWPTVNLYREDCEPEASCLFLLTGTEPSRNWKRFSSEIVNTLSTIGISQIIFLGAMLADVPHTRPITVQRTSENAALRAELECERSSYEGPVGILSVLAEAAENQKIATVSLWASVPHYVHNSPSPKATLALIDELEKLLNRALERENLAEEALAWQSGIDALATDDDEMASYIQQLEQARDTVDSPEASGEAIAQQFERYLQTGNGEENNDSEPQPGHS